jgi:uncharacterized damage-inducible protein DinB
MKVTEMLLKEFDQEIQKARRVLERVPEGRFDWKPHDRSMTLGHLATHVARLPQWAAMLAQSDLDISPDGKPVPQPPAPETRAALLALLDQCAGAGRAYLADVSEEDLGRPWSLLAAGQTIFTQPKVEVLRHSVLSHLAHHRGQLTVYLRLNEAPVPGIYGPSADEPTFS